MHPVYKDVDSSNIQAVAYADGKGFVEFFGGRRFAYTMPKMVFDEMVAAKSIGSYFARNVKGRYEVAGTSQRCNLMSCREDATLQGDVAGGKFYVCGKCAKTGPYANTTLVPINQESKK